MIEYKLKAIEEKHLLSTLLYLYENGESIKTEIYSNVSRNPSDATSTVIAITSE